MSEARKNMSKALTAVVVPVLRERGFSGSFPHLRRIQHDRLELLTFQFDRYGGGFIIELGQCGPDGFTTHWGKHIQPKHVTAWDVSSKQRTRIQPRAGSGTDSWFRFDDARSANDFASIADSVLPFIPVIEDTFRDFDSTRKLGEVA